MTAKLLITFTDAAESYSSTLSCIGSLYSSVFKSKLDKHGLNLLYLYILYIQMHISASIFACISYNGSGVN